MAKKDTGVTKGPIDLILKFQFRKVQQTKGVKEEEVKRSDTKNTE